ATADAHVDAVRGAFGLGLGERRSDGSLSLAETVCLGFCHSSPAVRDGETMVAGPTALADVIAGRGTAAAEPVWQSVLDEPVLIRPGDYSGLRRALAEWTPVELLAEVKE